MPGVQAAEPVDRMTSTSSSRVGPGAYAGRQPSLVDRPCQWLGRPQGLGQRGHREVASGVLADPGVGFDRGGDEVGGERDAQVEVFTLPAPDHAAVDRDVVGHPGFDVVVAPGAERFGHGGWVGALVEKREQRGDLHAGHRDPAPSGRGRGRHRVPHGDQSRRAGLSPVDVAQRPADENRRGGLRAVRLGPLGERRDGSAGGLEGGLEPQCLECGVRGGAHEHHREVAGLVQEDQALVAVEVGHVGDRAHHGAGLCSRSQPVGAVDVREAAVAVELRVAALRARPAKAPGSARGVHDEVGLDEGSVDPSADDPTAVEDESVDVTRAQGEAGLLRPPRGEALARRSTDVRAPPAPGEIRRGSAPPRAGRPGPASWSKASGHSAWRVIGTWGRNPWACSNCMTPRRIQASPVRAGVPVHRSDLVTRGVRGRRRAGAPSGPIPR